MTKPFLTDQQTEVLKLRELGLTQKEVSERLGTTRENISIVEKRARTNIERSRQTLKEWEKIKAPITIRIEKGVDILDIPKLLFLEADTKGIKVKSNLVGIITNISEEKKDMIEKRVLTHDLEVTITSAGEIKLN